MNLLKKWWNEFFALSSNRYIPGNDWQDHHCGSDCHQYSPRAFKLGAGWVCDEHDRYVVLRDGVATHPIGGSVCFEYTAEEYAHLEAQP